MNKNTRYPYTTDDIRTILEMRSRGCSYKQISEKTGRTPHALSQLVSKDKRTGFYSNLIAKKADLKVGGIKVAEVPESAIEKPVGIIVNGKERGLPVMEMTPREMIKKLYDLGYRIENNQLVCYQKVFVKVNDILNES